MWLEKCLFIVLLGCVLTRSDAKSSLTFVIDDTGSMGDDIDGVKENTNIVFDSVLRSNESQIDNFILITFNDPDTKVLTTTKDRDTFKNALASIIVDGGGDCPEYSMTGIETALEVSHPNSYIYVFTDASAKDDYKLEKVRNTAVSRQSQIVFLLTGYCIWPIDNYEAYYTLAQATDGKVFHMEKSNVGEVLKYISDTIESKKTKLIEKKLPPGHHNIKYNVDGTVKDTTIALSGNVKEKIDVAVFKPNGTKADTETIMDIPNNKILKVTDPETGIYTAQVDGTGDSTLTITAKTSFDFRHGFSTLKPSSLNATSIRPIAGVESNILIQLETADENIKLKSIEIYDLDGNDIMHFDVQVLDEKTKTYFTRRFIPPSYPFKIAINAQNQRTHEVIKRYSKPIEPQKPELVDAHHKSYTVEILDGDRIIVKNNTPLILACKINGYPKPTVQWKNLESGKEMPSSLSVVEPPYEYVSILDIPIVTNNGTYVCMTNTDGAGVTKNIDVIVENSPEERPVINKDVSKVSVLQGSDVKLTCRLRAGVPMPKIMWTYLVQYSNMFFESDVNSSTIIIKNVNEENAGTYKCTARNTVGADQHKIRLNVEYPPSIKRDYRSVNMREGTSKLLHCFAKGNPKPHIIWTFNDKIVVPDGDHRIYRDHSLKIKASQDNSGNYSCNARNKHGTDIKTIEVNFVVPVSIEIPGRSTFDTRVGRAVQLECRADGYPEPTIEWTFRSTDPEVSPRTLKADITGSVFLRDLKLSDDGFYTCNASNIDGSSNITYQIIVNGPPEIINVEKSMYRAVEGDLVVRIPCKAVGRPKPVITWSLEGLNIAKGTKWYDVEEDGTLVIRNVDIKSRGYHLCKATNKIGADQKYFFVDVSRSPYEDTPTDFVALKQGETRVLNCPLSSDIGSELRWYKDGNVITEGDLIIDAANATHSGLYTCRMSSFAGSRSATVELIVTFAPEFETEPETNIQFEEKSFVELDCSNYAEPPAKTEWYFNGERVDTDSDRHYFQMLHANIGEYTCLVSNKIGSISRKFVIISHECALHMKSDFEGNLPLMEIPYDLSVKTDGDYLYIPKGLVLELTCPVQFTSIDKSRILAKCIKGSNFLVEGEEYKFSDLKCSMKIVPEVKKRGFRCGHANTEIVDVGYRNEDKFMPVYEVCLDKSNNVAIFTKITLRRTLSDIDPKYSDWFDSENDVYNCDWLKLLANLYKWTFGNDTCCFDKRQLVSPKDVMPGLPQLATYSKLNVIPQWSSCNSENWNDLEDRIRSLAKSTDKNLLMWTGQAGQLTLENWSKHDVNITITVGSKELPVPKYLWKVIQDPSSRASLAIVQINIPDLKPEDAKHHVLCTDICPRIPWMQGGSWGNVTRGYTYCCAIREFENVFGYRNKFSVGGDGVLTHVSYISTHSLV
ncbi:hemicentin-1 [Amyelois transitella]|uniref:hemicentin-1 n=1 Tax=Amyelois transitella TaxID=680683 RepID=UPI00067DE024|nr:hemicentin-1 [Amyelois transitella]